MFDDVDPDNFDFSAPGGPTEIDLDMRAVASRLWSLYSSLVETGFTEQQSFAVVLTVIQAEVSSA